MLRWHRTTSMAKSLSQNQIEDLPAGALDSVFLFDLFLANNNICAIRCGSFPQTLHLKELNWGNNPVATI